MWAVLIPVLLLGPACTGSVIEEMVAVTESTSGSDSLGLPDNNTIPPDDILLPKAIDRGDVLLQIRESGLLTLFSVDVYACDECHEVTGVVEQFENATIPSGFAAAPVVKLYAARMSASISARDYAKRDRIDVLHQVPGEEFVFAGTAQFISSINSNVAIISTGVKQDIEFDSGDIVYELSNESNDYMLYLEGYDVSVTEALVPTGWAITTRTLDSPLSFDTSSSSVFLTYQAEGHTFIRY